MARSDKLFQKRKARERAWSGKRRSEVAKKRPVNKRVLISCEGSKTEPSYFTALQEELELYTVHLEIIKDCGSAPISVVKAALDHLKSDSDYEAVFCVFDKDTHESYQAALDMVVQAAKSRKYKDVERFLAITSVPSFELWLMMHFEPHSKPYGGKSPAKDLSSELRKKDGFENYCKGDLSLFRKLISLTEEACRNSRIVWKSTNEGGGDNPHTLMHVLVEYLMTLK